MRRVTIAHATNVHSRFEMQTGDSCAHYTVTHARHAEIADKQ